MAFVFLSLFTNIVWFSRVTDCSCFVGVWRLNREVVWMYSEQISKITVDYGHVSAL